MYLVPFECAGECWREERLVWVVRNNENLRDGFVSVVLGKMKLLLLELELELELEVELGSELGLHVNAILLHWI